MPRRRNQAVWFVASTERIGGTMYRAELWIPSYNQCLAKTLRMPDLFSLC